MATFETDDLIVTYEDSKAVKDAVFKRVMAYFNGHRMYHGEGIHQMDNTIIDAPCVMSDIADDIIKFKVTYKD